MIAVGEPYHRHPAGFAVAQDGRLAALGRTGFASGYLASRSWGADRRRQDVVRVSSA